MLLFSCRGINKAYRDLEVLKGIDLDIHSGDRIGIVGKNGAGKTTLANILSGSLQADEGKVASSRVTLDIGYLLQSTAYTVHTFSSMAEGEAGQGGAGDFNRISGALGLIKVQQWEPERFAALSGGEKTKLALAHIFTSRPDILLLDEPTNHLDFQGVDWLTGRLAAYKGAVLLISHDRYFLDRTVTKILELSEGKVREYIGSYTDYRESKKREHEVKLHQYLEQEKRKVRIRSEIEQVKKWSAKAHREAGKVGKMAEMRKGKEFFRSAAKAMDTRARSQIKRLERMEAGGLEKPKEETGLSFLFEEDAKLGRRLLEAKAIGKGFGGRNLFLDSSFYIKRGDKVGVLGPNGCGKTTLVKLILGSESLDSGEIWLSPSARITYISQDVEDLRPEDTPMDVLKVVPGYDDFKARSILAGVEIQGAMLHKPIRELSLGERTRVKIAGAILDGRDFLILDEPTNHLDLYSREQLEEALVQYEGTVLVISHDRYLLERVCSRLLIFKGRTLSMFDGKYEEYRQKAEVVERLAGGNGNSLREEQLRVENQLAALVNGLGRMSREHPEYARLDQEYRELMERRKQLASTVKGR